MSCIFLTMQASLSLFYTSTMKIGFLKLLLSWTYEPRHEKTSFLYIQKQRRSIFKNKDADQTTKLISAFVFTTQIVQSLYFLNLKFQASSHLLWLHSLVYVGPGWKPRRQVFSRRGSYVNNQSTDQLLHSYLCCSLHS